LRQVVTNLILNALDAMDGEWGTLTLRTEHLRLEAPEDERYGVCAGSYVKLTVRVTGVGVHPDARERLFEPFFSTKGAGRGMGLAAAARIVQAHRGWLGLDETSNRGASFAVPLPVATESIQHCSKASTPPGAAAPSRSILLVDD